MKDDLREVVERMTQLWTDRPELFDHTWPYLVLFFAFAFLVKLKPTTTKRKPKKS